LISRICSTVRACDSSRRGLATMKGQAHRARDGDVEAIAPEEEVEGARTFWALEVAIE
jgi:hypothetical protein